MFNLIFMYSGDIQLYRQMDSAEQTIALVVVPERLGHECNLSLDRARCHDLGLFFERILDIVMECSFKSIVLPIPGWQLQTDGIQVICTILCQVLLKRGPTLRWDSHITVMHSNTVITSALEGDLQKEYLAHKGSLSVTTYPSGHLCPADGRNWMVRRVRLLQYVLQWDLQRPWGSLHPTRTVP